MSLFTIDPHTTLDKSFDIHGPEGLLLSVDFDDVHHTMVEALSHRIVELLNHPDNVADLLDLADVVQTQCEERWAAEEAEGETPASLSDVWWATYYRGQQIVCLHDPYVHPDAQILANGEPIKITGPVKRYRDGGTTVIPTEIGTMTRPSPLRSLK